MRPFAALAIALSLIAATAQAAEEERRTLTVTGTGEVSAAPDMANVDLGVTSQADTARAALDANTAAMNEVMQALKDLGIAEKDIRTSGFNVQPRYRHDPQRPQSPEITGYEVSNTVHVSVRALAGLGRLLDTVVSRGSNTINGLSFGFADRERIVDEARRAAGADARRKAELFAEGLGVRLGPIVAVSEAGGGQGPVPVFARTMAMEAAVPIATGEQTVSASVTVSWRID